MIVTYDRQNIFYSTGQRLKMLLIDKRSSLPCRRKKNFTSAAENCNSVRNSIKDPIPFFLDQFHFSGFIKLFLRPQLNMFCSKVGR
jgi:hypothetical protein